MKILIAFTFASAIALFAAGMQERFVGHSSDWIGMIVFVSAFVIAIHRLQLQARHR